ncbi:hypothetical protein H0Z60_14585 [Ectothiorhodospiraceae bacterium WFHF3C12]|nr:hypothetical protein [Ectothiorhodospiraceae bacterium WFHF3C12]
MLTQNGGAAMVVETDLANTVNRLWCDFKNKDSASIHRKMSPILAHALDQAREESLELAYSFRHNLGFSKYVLAECGVENCQLRLHVWEADVVDMPHSHPWDFQSLVLSGRLWNSTYRAAGSGVMVDEIVARSDFRRPGFRYNRCGKRFIEMTSSEELAAFDFYGLPYYCVHASSTSFCGAATLFLRGPAKRKKSYIYKFQEEEKKRPYLEKIRKDEYEESVSWLASLFYEASE